MEISILGNKVRMEVVLLCFIVGAVIGRNLFCNCTINTEGFESLNGSDINYSIGNGVKLSWEHENKDYNYNSWFKDLENNTDGFKPPFPNNLNQLDMLEKNKFSPECCPSTYSNSNGCACITPEQMKYLNNRGGNRTLNTQF